MSEVDRLQGFIDLWWAVVAENVALLRSLQPADWTKPTDLPGWRHRTLFFRDPEGNVIEIYAEY